MGAKEETERRPKQEAKDFSRGSRITPRLGPSEGHGTMGSGRQMRVCCVCLSYKMNRPLHSHKHLTCASCRRTILQVQLAGNDAAEFTLERSVLLNRIRLLRGGDGRLPSTLEARLSIQDDAVTRDGDTPNNNNNNGTDAITGANGPLLDESTCLSSWGL